MVLAEAILDPSLYHMIIYTIRLPNCIQLPPLSLEGSPAKYPDLLARWAWNFNWFAVKLNQSIAF